MHLLQAGNRERAVASTQMNETSSRSHAVFTILLTQRDLVTQAHTRAKVHLVDLAGSERVKQSGAKGETLREAVRAASSLLESSPHALIPTTPSNARRLILISHCPPWALSSRRWATGDSAGPQRTLTSLVGAEGRRPISAPARLGSPPTETPSSPGSCGIAWAAPRGPSCLPTSGGRRRRAPAASVRARSSPRVPHSPCESAFEETVSTLRFVERAKRIAAAPVRNHREVNITPEYVERLQRELRSAKREAAEAATLKADWVRAATAALPSLPRPPTRTRPLPTVSGSQRGGAALVV